MYVCVCACVCVCRCVGGCVRACVLTNFTFQVFGCGLSGKATSSRRCRGLRAWGRASSCNQG